MAALLALLSSLLWGAADFLGGTATRRLPATAVVLASQAAALVLLVPLVVALGADAVVDVAGWGVAAGVVGSLSLLAFYRALATGTMGIVAPVAALGVAVPVVAGLVAGEDPSAAQLAGMAVAAVGVVLACGPELSGEGRGGVRPLVLALVAALGFGTVFVLLAEAAGGEGAGVGEVLATLLVMRAASVLLLSGVRVLERSSRREPAPVAAGPAQDRPVQPAPARVRRGDVPLLVVIGVLDVGANGTYAVATQSGLVSVTAVLASLYPVITGLLAWRVHGERLAALQWAGVALAMAGVLLLAGG